MKCVPSSPFSRYVKGRGARGARVERARARLARFGTAASAHHGAWLQPPFANEGRLQGSPSASVNSNEGASWALRCITHHSTYTPSVHQECIPSTPSRQAAAAVLSLSHAHAKHQSKLLSIFAGC
eukprot:6175544-Pleurochrysis_carterae.AAC.1